MTLIVPNTASQETVQDVTDVDTWNDLSCETAALSDGVDYIVSYAGAGGQESNSAVTSMRLLHGSTVMAEAAGEHASDSDGFEGLQLAGVVKVTGNGTDTLKFEGKVSSLPDGHFRGMQIWAWPLTDLSTTAGAEDYLYEGSDSDTYDLTNITSETLLDSFTFTAPILDDYLIICCFEGRPANILGNNSDFCGVDYELDDVSMNGGLYRLEWEDDVDHFTFGFARVETALAAGSHTLRIEVSGNGDADFRKARFFVLRLGALNQYQLDESSGVESDNSSGYRDTSYGLTLSPESGIDAYSWMIFSAPHTRSAVGGHTRMRLAQHQGSDADAYLCEGGGHSHMAGSTNAVGKDLAPALLMGGELTRDEDGTLDVSVQWSQNAASRTGYLNQNPGTTDHAPGQLIAIAMDIVGAIHLLTGAGVSTSAGAGDLECDVPITGAGASVSVGAATAGLDPAALEGAGAGIAVGYATLTCDVAVTGAGASVSVGTGTLALDSAALAGEGAVTSVGAGPLGCDVAITGAGVAVSVGAASPMQAAVAITGAGAAVSAGAATPMQADVAITGAGTAVSAGAGTLTAGSDMAGAGVAASAGAGTLGATVGITGAGTAVAAGAGTLGSDRAITGAGAAVSVGAGTMDVGLLLGTGAGAAVSSGAGGLACDSPFVGAGTAVCLGTGTVVSDRGLAGGGVAVSAGDGTLVTTELLLIGAATGTSVGAGILITASDWRSLSLVTEELVAILEQDVDLRIFRETIRGTVGVYGTTERRIFPPYLHPEKNLFGVEERNMPYVSVSPINGQLLSTKGEALNSDTEITRRIVCIMPRAQYPSYEGDADMKQAYVLIYRALFNEVSRARLEALGVEAIRMIRTNMDGLSIVTPQPAFALDLGMTVKGERFMA